MTQKIGYALILCLLAILTYACTFDHQVLQAQKMLKDLGYSIEKVDGKKGPNTTRIIRQFQKANGLRANGEINDSTIQALKHSVSRQNESSRRGIAISSTVPNGTAFHISGQQIYT